MTNYNIKEIIALVPSAKSTANQGSCSNADGSGDVMGQYQSFMADKTGSSSPDCRYYVKGEVGGGLGVCGVFLLKELFKSGRLEAARKLIQILSWDKNAEKPENVPQCRIIQQGDSDPTSTYEDLVTRVS